MVNSEVVLRLGNIDRKSRTKLLTPPSLVIAFYSALTILNTLMVNNIIITVSSTILTIFFTVIYFVHPQGLGRIALSRADAVLTTNSIVINGIEYGKNEVKACIYKWLDIGILLIRISKAGKCIAVPFREEDYEKLWLTLINHWRINPDCRFSMRLTLNKCKSMGFE
ncbi:MAG: hypothetical protein L7G96_02295 [Vulcanisaeta sp.]|nr:hypothetical protein [Vulcanisaeta sp.]